MQSNSLVLELGSDVECLWFSMALGACVTRDYTCENGGDQAWLTLWMRQCDPQPSPADCGIRDRRVALADGSMALWTVVEFCPVESRYDGADDDDVCGSSQADIIADAKALAFNLRRQHPYAPALRAFGAALVEDDDDVAR